MDRRQLEEKGYKFNITPFGWMVEWRSKLLDDYFDPYHPELGTLEEAIRQGLKAPIDDLRRCQAKELRGKNLEEIEKDAVETANVDWVMRRIRK